MPEYLVLRCYKCGIFQAHILRKDSKFSCKLCGEKQSYQKVYARSYKPTDVSSVVKEYNMRRGVLEEQETRRIHSNSSIKNENQIEMVENSMVEKAPVRESWDDFLDKEAVVEEGDLLQEQAEDSFRHAEGHLYNRNKGDVYNKNKRKNFSSHPESNKSRRDIVDALSIGDTTAAEPPLKKPRFENATKSSPARITAHSDASKIMPSISNPAPIERKEVHRNDEWDAFIDNDDGPNGDSQSDEADDKEGWERL